jgi:(S)-2-hydroxyglutarate dehydrogenase
VIGAGIIGLATALELSRRFPGMSIVVLDKEKTVGAHQTSHNSGVIHSGIYYTPGSLKARLCVSGARALVNFCQEHNLPYEICGKVIVASSIEEVSRLEELYRRGQSNGLNDLKMLSADEIREYEPYSFGIRGIHVPETGIINYRRVAEKFVELIVNSGGQLFLSHEVIAIKQLATYSVLETTKETVTAKFIVNCAGLHSDRISRMANMEFDLRIIPFRGEYYELAPSKQGNVKNLIYPVPDSRFPFLGIHFTRQIEGGVEVGPNAVLALKREGYSQKAFEASDVLDSMSFPGFWKMAAKYWKTSVAEYYRSWNKRAFVRALQRLMPDICEHDLIPGGSGVRAQAVDINGRLIDDFYFIHSDRMLHVCNVPSPAATASLAIGKHIVNEMLDRI